jgi:hypothetical protein
MNSGSWFGGLAALHNTRLLRAAAQVMLRLRR